MNVSSVFKKISQRHPIELLLVFSLLIAALFLGNTARATRNQSECSAAKAQIDQAWLENKLAKIEISLLRQRIDIAKYKKRYEDLDSKFDILVLELNSIQSENVNYNKEYLKMRNFAEKVCDEADRTAYVVAIINSFLFFVVGLFGYLAGIKREQNVSA